MCPRASGGTAQSREGKGVIMKQETIDRIRKFTEDRDWDQFHSPANLAKSIVIEAAELLECFQWSDGEYDLQQGRACRRYGIQSEFTG